MALQWIKTVDVEDVDLEDVIGFDRGELSLAIYRSPNDEFFATEGWCTHGQALLCEGLVMGDLIECPKHNGRFDYRTGEPRRIPVQEPLRTYPVKVEDGVVYVGLDEQIDG